MYLLSSVTDNCRSEIRGRERVILRKYVAGPGSFSSSKPAQEQWD